MGHHDPTPSPHEALPLPLWARVFSRIVIALLILVATLGSYIALLAWDKSRIHEVNSRPIFDGVMDDTPIPQARAQTIDLLLAIYQALEDQADIGPWEPVTNEYQIQGARLTCSPDGEGTNEEYRLATAQGTITLDQANTIISQVAEPHGFTTHEHFKDSFIRHSDGAEIWLTGRDSGQTTVNITTGCHPGTIYQDWPTGTENIPTHLRGIGRRHQDHETWSPHEPANPTPSPPPNWTPPTPTTRPERPSHQNTTTPEEG